MATGMDSRPSGASRRPGLTQAEAYAQVLERLPRYRDRITAMSSTTSSGPISDDSLVALFAGQIDAFAEKHPKRRPWRSLLRMAPHVLNLFDRLDLEEASSSPAAHPAVRYRYVTEDPS